MDEGFNCTGFRTLVESTVNLKSMLSNFTGSDKKRVPLFTERLYFVKERYGPLVIHQRT